MFVCAFKHLVEQGAELGYTQKGLDQSSKILIENDQIGFGEWAQ